MVTLLQVILGRTAHCKPTWRRTSIEAARRGATVRLLLDSRYDDGDNQGTADYVNGIARSEGPDLERTCPTVSRATIRRVLGELRARCRPIHV